jgi:hypothetical protein
VIKLLVNAENIFFYFNEVTLKDFDKHLDFLLLFFEPIGGCIDKGDFSEIGTNSSRILIPKAVKNQGLNKLVRLNIYRFKINVNFYLTSTNYIFNYKHIS